MKLFLKILFYLFLLIFVFQLGKSNGDPNKEKVYGDSGFPKNCRAIIYENQKGYYQEIYTSDEALDSILRNCGDSGEAWEN